MTLTCALLIASAARTGIVRLHLTDAHNQPIPHHELFLTSTNSTKSVRPFGVQWYIPGGPDTYRGKTDRNGDVAISGVPLRRPMMVVTRFGPRFDAFVGKDNPSGGSLDVMKFEGAVYAGKRAHVVLADDREITGSVTDAAGKPLSGVKVLLSDTGFGHMGGYPGTTLDEQTTDAKGVYRFRRLPNCVFLVSADAAPDMAIESRPGKGPWELIAIVGQEWTSASALLSRPISICDFRISRTALLKVVFKGAPSELKGWTAWFESGSAKTTGQQLDYAPSHATMSRNIRPGLVTVWLERDNGKKWIVAKRINLKAGESQTLEISLADVIKRPSK